ncbi:EAL and HDOD domain-containing protein [Alkalibacter mobilis]|uniref:EAL and HDOD domain-containing protein n=1 Tax=Alkalibacter mobilis TaxID=2787712 RepID=UPI00189E8095|nr:EAL domain-containing protein [Alkalibacter mobilis]MBF7096803.1 EAL domain-containing protein [Alkalibacter mobilis]
MYIARQPIFKTNKDVYGYELLFRLERDSSGFGGATETQATASIITSLFESGIETIVENKRAFINFNRELLELDLVELLDKNRLVIEVLENVELDPLLIERIQCLSNNGYEIALDDFVESYEEYPLVKYADIIKHDIIATPLETIEISVEKALKDRKILLAEKIETEEEFLKAKEMGFKLFQGYFFSKPSVVGQKNETITTTKIQYLRILQELDYEEPSYQKLAEIIEMDVNLAYRLLRVVSARVGDDLIYSIKRALTFMGLKELERWIKVLMIQELGVNKPKELVRISLIRSKLSELIALSSNLKKSKHEAAIMGLFSTIDAILDMDMEDALKDITLSPKVSNALVLSQGELSIIKKIIEAYEIGEWSEIDSLAKEINIEQNAIYDHYLESVKWSKEIMDMIY